jgi:valyl-tRNA synthetase
MVAAWPSFRFADARAEAEIGSLMRLVTEVRQFRSGQGLRPGQRVPARLAGIEGTTLAAHEESIRALLRLTVPEDEFTASASLLAEGITVELNLAGTVDVAAERKRLERDLAAARKEAQSMTSKLGNEAFTAKAPADVIEKSRARLEAAQADIARLESRLARLLSPVGDDRPYPPIPPAARPMARNRHRIGRATGGFVTRVTTVG